MYDLLSELFRYLFSYQEIRVQYIRNQETLIHNFEAEVFHFETIFEDAKKRLHEAKSANKATLNGISLAEFEAYLNQGKTLLEEQKKLNLSFKEKIEDAKRFKLNTLVVHSLIE
ncbi:unnamed protein product [Dovyalis caffra]|uniref:Uncharacterized protein n=1 Tax=Dovyalis caffra TaxID=77055 RepID=A0AAV1S2L4_9ROSI|nr:unnamed protein product [Dovyalis caffra]